MWKVPLATMTLIFSVFMVFLAGCGDDVDDNGLLGEGVVVLAVPDDAGNDKRLMFDSDSVGWCFKSSFDGSIARTWYNERDDECYFYADYDVGVPGDVWIAESYNRWYTNGTGKLYLVDIVTYFFGGSPTEYTYSITRSAGGVRTLLLTDGKGISTTWTYKE